MSPNDGFPTAESLRAANNRYVINNAGKTQSTDSGGLPKPKPAAKTKDELLKLSNFRALDKKVCGQVSSLNFR